MDFAAKKSHLLSDSCFLDRYKRLLFDYFQYESSA